MIAPEPKLEFAFDIHVDIAAPTDIGRGVDEKLSFTPITGGTVAGPLLNGSVRAGGGDWAVERSGTFQVEARYLLEADDGAVIDIVNRGYYRAEESVIARLVAGDAVDPSEYYFRTAPMFQTDAPAHRWLAENQFVGIGRDEDEQVRIACYVLR